MTRGYYPNLKQMPWKRVSERKKETTTQNYSSEALFPWCMDTVKKKKRKDFFFTRSAPALEIIYSYNPIVRI